MFEPVADLGNCGSETGGRDLVSCSRVIDSMLAAGDVFLVRFVSTLPVVNGAS